VTLRGLVSSNLTASANKLMADNLGNTTEVTNEFSAGGIVYKKQDDQLLILLIRTSGATATERDNVWTFPKGHIDEGEDSETAALREVREESGVVAKIIDTLPATEYSFVGFGKNIHKTVNWYLMEYVFGNITDHDDEVAEVRWIGIDDANAQLTYKLDRENLERVKNILNANA